MSRKITRREERDDASQNAPQETEAWAPSAAEPSEITQSTPNELPETAPPSSSALTVEAFAARYAERCAHTAYLNLGAEPSWSSLHPDMRAWYTSVARQYLEGLDPSPLISPDFLREIFLEKKHLRAAGR